MADLGLISVREPFTNLLAQGMVIKDGAKMSKSKGNVVDPDEIIEKYGADTLRLFILFAAPAEGELEWSDKGISGCFRFLNRVYKLKERVIDGYDERLYILINKTIKAVSLDLERFSFNTAIAHLMEFLNEIKGDIPKDIFKQFLILLFPFAPHIASELWENFGFQPKISDCSWLSYDKDAISERETTIVIQINGKLRGKIVVPYDTPESKIKQMAMDAVANKLSSQPKNIIFVPNRLVNIVV